jgi:hypothetical protein
MKVILICILISLLYSCSEDDCIKRITMVGIGERTIPDTVIRLNHAQIKLEAEATSGCWSDLYIELNEIKEFEYSIKAYGTFESCGICPHNMVYKDTVIDFQPTQTGVYLFKISELPDRIIFDTIIVE